MKPLNPKGGSKPNFLDAGLPPAAAVFYTVRYYHDRGNITLRHPLWKHVDGPHPDLFQFARRRDMLTGTLTLLVFIADIYGISRILNTRAPGEVKFIWSLLIILLPVLGLMVWFLFGPKKPTRSLIRTRVKQLY